MSLEAARKASEDHGFVARRSRCRHPSPKNVINVIVAAEREPRFLVSALLLAIVESANGHDLAGKAIYRIDQDQSSARCNGQKVIRRSMLQQVWHCLPPQIFDLS